MKNSQKFDRLKNDSIIPRIFRKLAIKWTPSNTKSWDGRNRKPCRIFWKGKTRCLAIPSKISTISFISRKALTFSACRKFAGLWWKNFRLFYRFGILHFSFWQKPAQAEPHQPQSPWPGRGLCFISKWFPYYEGGEEFEIAFPIITFPRCRAHLNLAKSSKHTLPFWPQPPLCMTTIGENFNKNFI